MKKSFAKIGFSAAVVVVAALFLLPVSPVRASAAAERDTALVTPYQAETALVAPPTVVYEPKTAADFETLPADGAGRSPANVILRLNGKGEVVAEDGSAVGELLDVYRKLDRKIIPVVSVSDDAGANAFINFMSDELEVLDIAVHSRRVSLVKKVREALPSVRGIVEYAELEDRYTAVKESTEAGAMVLVLPQAVADAETVAYFQARFKTVWVRAESASKGDLCDCVFGGAYGVVTEDYGKAYDLLKELPAGYSRNIFNVGHRALPNIYNENSLGGIRGAVEAGVTHLELDGHLTKDKRIVIIHDDTINGATNGTGTIENMTLDEIRQYDLDLKTPHEKVPTFEEVIDLIKELNKARETHVVLLFEIKDNQKDFVEYMKKILDEKDFYEDIVIITFQNTEKQLDALKEQVPMIPTANLDSMSLTAWNGAMAALNGYHAGVSLSNSLYSKNYDRLLADHGFIGWFWTYAAERDVLNAAKQGVAGVTTNSAECYGDGIRYVYGTDVGDAGEEDIPAVGAAIALTAVNYRGETREVQGKVTYVEETEEGWRCFATYEDTFKDGTGRLIFARGVNYLRPEQKKGCGGVIGIGGGAAVLLLAGAALLCKKK